MQARLAFSLGLTSFSSFSLADRVQASLILARSCVSCTNFNLLRSLKVLSLTEKYPNKFGISFAYSYLCRQLTASEPLQRFGFTGIRCESGTVPAAVSPLAIVCLLHSLATDNHCWDGAINGISQKTGRVNRQSILDAGVRKESR